PTDCSQPRQAPPALPARRSSLCAVTGSCAMVSLASRARGADRGRWVGPPRALGEQALLARCPGTAQIKHFLKEDSEEAELAQFLKEFPSGESFRKVEPEEGKRAHGQGPIDPGMFSSVAWPIADELLDDKELRPFSQPRPLDFQQHIAAPAPPSPSRPRSPWGKLDPYDSSEDDKEYVGFATLPNQVHRKSVKKGFDFTLMVAGESGLGKSTLVSSLFLTDMYRDHKLLSAEERITQTVEITKHVVDIEEKGVKLRLTIVDTPGFGDAVNNTE
ncbi:septin 4, partial [Chelydra serpentina]